MITLFTTSDVLAAPPEVHNCSVVTKKSAGTPLAISTDPAIVLVNTPYQPDAAPQTLDWWKNTAKEISDNTKGFSSVIVVEDRESNSVREEYVLQSWGDFEAIAARYKSHDSDNASRVPTDIVKVKAVAGFLGRDDKSKL